MKRAYTLFQYVLNHKLNRKGKLAAVKRIASWQISSSLFPGGCVVPFVNDTCLLMNRGMHGATGNWYCGLHEADEMAFVLHALKPDEMFLDAGSNIGSYAILAAGAVGANVVAIEPVPDTFKFLKQNISLNNLDVKITAMNTALSDRNGYLKFSVDKGAMNHVLRDDTADTFVEVQVFTLDEICEEQIPTIIKIDVEGHEHAVIKGASQILSNPIVEAVIIENNDATHLNHEIDSDLETVMSRFNFYACSYDIFKRKIMKTRVGKGNVIFIRDIRKIQDRVSNAPEFRLVNGKI